MTASLPMYDRSTTRGPNDRLWARVREALGRGPQTLDRDTDPRLTWHDPDLVLSQTCGLPFRLGLNTHVTYVGTPDYGVRGCLPGYYKSYIVVRRDDPRKRLSEFEKCTLARNSVLSQSGWAAMENHLVDTGAGFSFERHAIDTGSHEASVAAVSAGEADIAAIDAVTWTLLKREGATGACRVLSFTRPTPGLPLITAGGTDPAPMRSALDRAIKSLSRRDRAQLLLKGVVQIPVEAYLDEPVPPSCKVVTD